MSGAHLPDGHLPTGHLPSGHLPGTEDGQAPVVTPPRRRFGMRLGAMRRHFPAMEKIIVLGNERTYIFADVTKNPGEQYEVELDAYAAVVSPWRENTTFVVGEYIRPRVPNGFAYIVEGEDGCSGSREPFWPKVIDGQVPDGSLTWKCVAAGTNALLAVSDPVAVPDQAALTITGISVDENHVILATYEGGEADTDYLVEWTFTVNGKSRKAHQLVRVRLQ